MDRPDESLLHEQGIRKKCSECEDYFESRNFSKHVQKCTAKLKKKERNKINRGALLPSRPHPFLSSHANVSSNEHLLQWVDSVDEKELSFTDLEEKPIVLFDLLERADTINKSSTIHSNSDVCIKDISPNVLIPMSTLHKFREVLKAYKHLKQPFSNQTKKNIVKEVGFDAEVLAHTAVPKFLGPLPTIVIEDNHEERAASFEESTEMSAEDNEPSFGATSSLPPDLTPELIENASEEISSNFYNPVSALRVFYCILLNWRLQNNVSQSAFNQLLRLIQELLLFAYAATTILSHEKEDLMKETKISDNALDDKVFSFGSIESLPISESSLRQKLNLSSISSKSKEFGYVQCHNTMCGTLLSKAELDAITRNQLATNKIMFKEAVQCPKCATPFHFDVLPECYSIRANLAESIQGIAVNQPIVSSSVVQHALIPTLPILRPQINSLVEWIRMKSKDSSWWSKLDNWKLKTRENRDKAHLKPILGDIWDGEIWRKYKKCSNNKPLLDPDARSNSAIALSLHVDGFQAHRKGLKNITIVCLTIANLPRDERFAPSNMFLFALLPGKDQSHCSTEQLNAALDKLVEEIAQLESEDGIQFRTPSSLYDDGRRRGFLLNVCADQPALREVCGFIGHGATQGCHYCTQSFDKRCRHITDKGTFYSLGSEYLEMKLNKAELSKNSRSVESEVFNISDWDDVLTHVPLELNQRTAFQTRKDMNEYERILKQQGDPVANKKKASETSIKTGVRYTPLSKLKNWDHITGPCLDVMHNIWLGVTKRYFKFLKNIKGALKDSLPDLNLWIKSAHIPSDIGRMPAKWTGQLGYLKASEMANFVTVLAIPSMICAGVDPLYIFPLIPLQRLSFLLRLQAITLEQIKEVEINIRLFYIFSLYVLGPSFFSINLHLMFHIPELLKLYGPPCNWWCFPYERMTGLINSFQRNETHVATSIMRYYQNVSDTSQCLIDLASKVRALETLFKSSSISLALGYHEHEILTIFNPMLPSIPSSSFLQSYVDLYLTGECNVDQQYAIARKLNSQGYVRTIRYQNTKQNFFNMKQWIDGHENRVKGYEPIPCLPKDKPSNISRQSFQFSHYNQFVSSGFKTPPKLDMLTDKLLQQFYESRYFYSNNYGDETLQQKSERFRTYQLISGDKNMTEAEFHSQGPKPNPISPDDSVQLYSQMFICGELYTSAWSNELGGGYIMSMFYDPVQKNISPWFGQIQFFFSHDLNFKQTCRNSSKVDEIPIRHTFAFVKWFKQVPGSTILSWKSLFDMHHVTDKPPRKRTAVKEKTIAKRPEAKYRKLGSNIKRQTQSQNMNLYASESDHESEAEHGPALMLNQDEDCGFDTDEEIHEYHMADRYNTDTDGEYEDETTVVDIANKAKASSSSSSSSSTVAQSTVTPNNKSLPHYSIEDKLSPSVIKSIETRKQELDKDFSSIAEYKNQLTKVVLDRLQQDFPLISSKNVQKENEMFKMILPIGRIWGRVAVWSSGSRDADQIAMHIPNRRHT